MLCGDKLLRGRAVAGALLANKKARMAEVSGAQSYVRGVTDTNVAEC